MENKGKVVIIGGGIAGLSAGIHALKAGYCAHIIESGNIGGECCAWKRDGAVIDGCIHWLTGTDDGDDLYDLWRNIGFEGEFYSPNSWLRFESGDSAITVWRDLDRFGSELINASADEADKQKVIKFIKHVRKLFDYQIPTEKGYGFLKAMTDLKYLPEIIYLMRSCDEAAQTFNSPVLKDFFAHAMRPEFPLFSLAFTIATFCSGNGDIPRGGSAEFVKAIYNKYKELGGTKQKAKAVSFTRLANRISAVVTEDGDSIEGDYFIPTCDIHITQKLLGTEPLIPSTDSANVISCAMVAFETTADCIDMPIETSFECEPFMAAGRTYSRMGLRCYNYEKFSPKGTVLTAYIDCCGDECDMWLALGSDGKRYENSKQTLAQTVTDRVKARFPQFSDIKVLDIVTPVTFNRYTGAHKGAYMAFMPKRPSLRAANLKVEGFDNLVLAGQWTIPPGGLPMAAVSGANAVSVIENNV